MVIGVIFSGWPKIERINAAAKTFYFHNEVSPLAGNWLLKEAVPESNGDYTTKENTSASNNKSIILKPGATNATALDGHGSTSAQGFGWWSDAALNGTFDAGAWTFVVRNKDGRSSITSHFDFSVFKVPQNTSVSGATLLFQHIGAVDPWLNTEKTTTETTATVGPFTLTNEYLLIEMWDHITAGAESGRTMEIITEGANLAVGDRTRVVTPNFTPPAAAAVTVGAGGAQAASMGIPSASNNIGGAFTLARNSGSADVTQIIITEQGAVNANANLSNVKLFYKTETACSAAIPADAAAFNATGVGFNASEKATATGSMTVGTSQICLYVQLDVGAGATDGQTLEIEISNPSAEVTVSAGTVNPGIAIMINGTTTMRIPGPSSSLSLKMADAAKNPTLFYLSGGALWMQEGISAAVPLTSSEVTVTALQFTNMSYANTPGTVRIQMTVAATNPQNRQEYSFEKTFYTTANIRKK